MWVMHWTAPLEIVLIWAVEKWQRSLRVDSSVQKRMGTVGWEDGEHGRAGRSVVGGKVARLMAVMAWGLLMPRGVHRQSDAVNTICWWIW